MSEFPSELLAVPQPLIGFHGLDLNNTVHKSIFDSFNNRVDRPTIQYKIIPFNYECPTKKPKRQSFEWYNPKHIMKKNWMLKYLHVLPSLIVVCVELEWKDPSWSEKQLNCSTIIQQLKTKFQDRLTKIALVLIQKTSTFLGTDDLIATERSSALANVCEINAKQLFVLPVNDQHLLGYTIRLESAFLELSQTFYIQLLKNYRSHQTNSSHQTLKVRHQFKMGFLCELRLDFPTALKYYTQAYANLEDIRIVDTNCLEIKTVAGFLNYKMCKLMFKLNLPRDSITQFKAHIEKYKTRTGFKELLFEHHSWMSIQFQCFAELFADAVKNGLAALQTQHPGIYYLKAAEYLYKRRDTFNQINGLPTTPIDDMSAGQFSTLYSDYFGVRNFANKNSETGNDQQIIMLVQEMEAKFNYSSGIINLLGQAMSQFKVYRCGRVRKKCAVMMADEYFKSGEYTKALTLYSLMLSDYRQEKWFVIFTDILMKTIQSAILASSVNDFVTSSVEALSPSIEIGKIERQNILENLWKVFNNSAPTYHNQIAPEIKQNWEAVLETHRSPITVEIDDIPNFIDCKATFEKNQVRLNEAVVVQLFVRSNTDVPVKVRSLAVCLMTNSGSNHRYLAKRGYEYEFNHATKSQNLLNEFKAEDFILESGKCFKFELEVNPREFVENVEVGITCVEITMGTEKNYAVLALRKSLNQVKYFQRYDIHSDFLEKLNIIKTCYVIPTFQLTSQSIHNQPMLINEYYKITINLSNNHEGDLNRVTITISLPTNLANKVYLLADQPSALSKLSSRIQIDVGTMKAHSNASKTFFITSLIEGSIELKQSLCYEIEDKTAVDDSSTFTQLSSPSETAKNIEKCFADKDDQHEIFVEYLDNNVVRKKRDDILIVPCVEEFHFESKFYTLNRNPAINCFKDEDIIMRCTLKMTSPFNVEILDAFFIADVNVDEVSNQNEKFKEKVELGSTVENLLILRPKNTTNNWMTKETFKKPVNDDATKIFNIKSTEVQRKISNVKEVVKDAEDDPFALKSKDHKLNYENCSEACKKIINNTLDISELIPTDDGKKKGFIKAKLNLLDEKSVDPMKKFGMYCIKWKKLDSEVVNESKFVIKGIDVREPLLNIYCAINNRVFVREFFTYKVTLKNPHASILNLIATFNTNSSDGFMFAGHRQVNVTILSYSQTDLSFNLYPLKPNFQRLPELRLEVMNSQEDSTKETLIESTLKTEVNPKQDEVNELLNRWMPKSVFVHPPTRKMA
ncbi:CLUMA_CG015189, isoform A [Clunio marinus]|uniref:Trafficking protein particle complex subunit 11 n=1 Tax=Clunio marinus TaxID=568069 RepID=A0A1J1IR97_9DIPT|nr:CLUMA_CG015189, isoform A [Clunio marinus]